MEWRAYLQMATGVGELTAARAREVAKSLVGGAAMALPGAGPVLVDIVRAEVERAVAALGLVRAKDLTTLRQRISELEREVDDLQATELAGQERAGPTKRVTARNEPAGPVNAQKAGAADLRTGRTTTRRASSAKKAGGAARRGAGARQG